MVEIAEFGPAAVFQEIDLTYNQENPLASTMEIVLRSESDQLLVLTLTAEGMAQLEDVLRTARETFPQVFAEPRRRTDA